LFDSPFRLAKVGIATARKVAVAARPARENKPTKPGLIADSLNGIRKIAKAAIATAE
jgi:hypothetical protein